MLESSRDSRHGQKVIELESPAKLNLSLLVYGKRKDGFHELHSVMAALRFADRLVISPSSDPGIILEISGLSESIPTGPENLICKAANLLEGYMDKPAGAVIQLEKNIPAGGGLGGASGNAAAALIGLNQLWNLNLNVEELATLASRIGSDVAFFLYGPLAECRGRGEIVHKLEGSLSKKVLLILPGIHVSTAEVYKNFKYDASLVNARRIVVDNLIKSGDFDGLFELGINSLLPVTMSYVPGLDRLREEIEFDLGRKIFMSGSGSTLYLCGDSDQQLQGYIDKIKKGDLGECCDFIITEFV